MIQVRPEMRRVFALMALIGGAFVLSALMLPTSADELQHGFSGASATSMVVFLLAATGLSLALFPFPVLAATGGLLFGVVWGTAATVTFATASAAVAFAVGRRAGGRVLAGAGGRRLAAARARVERNGFVAVLWIRVLPHPRGALSYALGLTSIGACAHAVATLVGTIPRAYAYSALGAGGLDELDEPEALVALVLLVALAFGGLVATRWSRHRESSGEGEPRP